MANASETLGTPNPAPGYRLRPDHIVAYQAFSGVVIIKFDGEEIARTNQAWLIEETGHKPVYYIPSHHVNAAKLIESTHVTRCPFKGKARYWNLKVGEHEVDNAVWSYEMPYDEALELAGLMAFYDSKVEIVTEV